MLFFIKLHQDDLVQYNLGDQLIKFLELYGRHFNYLRTGIRIRDGGQYFSKDDNAGNLENRFSLLCIEDPLNSGELLISSRRTCVASECQLLWNGVNCECKSWVLSCIQRRWRSTDCRDMYIIGLGRLVTANDIGQCCYGAMKVREAFDNAFKELRDAVLPQYHHVQPFRASFLGRILRVPPEILAYRQHIRQKYCQFIQLASAPSFVPQSYQQQHLFLQVAPSAAEVGQIGFAGVVNSDDRYENILRSELIFLTDFRPLSDII